MSKKIDIIVTFKYSIGKKFENYIKYTNRDDAVKIEDKKIEFESTTENQELLNEINQVYEDQDNFADYLNYTKRESATIATEGLTSAFNKNSNNLPLKEFENYREKLKTASKNGNVLWEGVISFDYEFLIESGILKANDFNIELQKKIESTYDKKELEILGKQRQIDQDRLKEVIAKQMSPLLIAEGIDQSSFWWGNIHLNTKHLHVHLGISEERSKRHRVLNPKNGNYERKGNFNIKNIKKFKSLIHHALKSEKSKALEIKREVAVATIKSELINDISDRIGETKKEQFLLNKIYNNLPSDTKAWRYKSNAKDFQVAKAYLKAFIDDYLQNNGLETFKKALKEQAESYQHSYISKFDTNQFVEKRVDDLRERTGNALLHYFKTRPPQYETTQIEDLSDTELSDLIEQVKNQDYLKKDGGLFKHEITQRILLLDQKTYNEQLAIINKVQPVSKDLNFVDYQKERLRKKIEYTTLQMIPSFSLTESQKNQKKLLANIVVSPSKVAIEKLTIAVFEERIQMLQEEDSLISTLEDKSLSNLIYGKSVKDILKQHVTDTEILKLKFQIHKNNELIRETKQLNHNDTNDTGEILIKDTKFENAKLFKQLNAIINEFPEAKVDIKKFKKEFAKYQNKSSETMSKGYLNKLFSALSQNNSKQMQALNKKIEDEDREDREEEKGR